MKQKYTTVQIVMELLAIASLLFLFGYLLLKWGDIPDRIPAHYNAQGVIDSWGNKSSVIVMPMVCLLIYAVLTGVTFFPSTWNMPIKITEENRERVYYYMKNMLIIMKLEIVAFFTYIAIQMAKSQMLETYFLIVFLVVIFGTIIIPVALTLKTERLKNTQ